MRSTEIIGYKVMCHDSGYAVSLADQRLRVKLRRGATVRFPGAGIYLSPNEQYVLDYYRSGENDVLLVLSFDPDAVVKGNLTDRESEVSVSKAKLIDYTILPDDAIENPRGTPKALTYDGAPTPEMIDAAHRLMKWSNGKSWIGYRSVCCWFVNGRPRFGLVGKPEKLNRFVEMELLPSHVDGMHFDYMMQHGMGLDVVLDRTQRWPMLRGGVGQTMPDGQVAVFDVMQGLASVLSELVGTEATVVVLPEPGEPYVFGEKQTVYYSTASKKIHVAKKPEWLVQVPTRNEQGDEIIAPGIDLCSVVPRISTDYMPIVGIAPDNNAPLMFAMHSFGNFETEDPFKPVKEHIKSCGGLLFPSIALAQFPSLNFGYATLFFNPGIILENLDLYRRRRALRSFIIYDTDAWTQTSYHFASTVSIEFAEQLTGNWDVEVWGGHLYSMGLRTTKGPSEAAPIEKASKLSSVLERRFKIWHRGANPRAINEKYFNKIERYHYAEAKANGILTPSTITGIAVPPSMKKKALAFMKAIGSEAPVFVYPFSDEEIKIAANGMGDDDASRVLFDVGWRINDMMSEYANGWDSELRLYRVEDLKTRKPATITSRSFLTYPDGRRG